MPTLEATAVPDMVGDMAKRNDLSISTPEELREALRAWRERKGLSQRDAAPVLGFSKQSIFAWESGVRFPRWKALAVIKAKLME